MAGENNKVVIVTGGSSGIGRCTASALKENGCIVYEFSRRNIPMEGVTHLSVDVTDEDAVNAAVQQVIQKETKIDAVINCAGFGISGAVEFTSMEQAKAQFDVNFFGTVTVNKAVLPFMRHQGKGHIVNISSVAAVAHIPFQTFYSASKAAVSSYSYALANEVKPYGIHVTVVELGDICTGFTKARQKSILGDEEYGGRISRSVSQMEHDEQNGMDPARIGRYIAGIVEKKNPAVVYVAGAQYKFLSLLCKLLPAALMKAVDTFDSDRRARFSTYASRCIENAILSPAHFQMEKRTHSFCKAAQMRQNGFSGLRKAVTFFYFKRYHVRYPV